MWGAGGVAGGACCACVHRVHLGQVVRLFGLLSSLSWRVLSFCPLSRFALGTLPTNMALFRIFRGFLARFGAFVWVRVVLVLCVACGAFVCVNS